MPEAKIYDSGFPFARPSYNSISTSEDGTVLYCLSSSSLDTGAQLFRLQASCENVTHLADVTEALSTGTKAIPQGKCHVHLVEASGQVYFATHSSHYRNDGGKEAPAPPPSGYEPYPGGYFVRYDCASGRLQPIVCPAPGEGIISMAVDLARGMLYGLTWPRGIFVRSDLRGRNVKSFPANGVGETGVGADYRVVCRAMVVDPHSGDVYFTLATGEIVRYEHDSEALEVVGGDDLRKDYFGQYEPGSPFHMGYHWRQAIWHTEERVLYGVHGKSGYLFRFDPAAERVTVLGRLTSAASQESGMFDGFSHGYLGFSLAPDNRTVVYITGSPRAATNERARNMECVGVQRDEDIHVVTFDILSKEYRDKGAVRVKTGEELSIVQSIALHGNELFCIGTLRGEGERTDLVRITVR